MKVLLVGGQAQNKLLWAQQQYGAELTSGDLPLRKAFAQPTIYRLHRLVRQLLQEGEDPRAFVQRQLSGRSSWIIICDELGGGVVPIDPFERQWREQVGRICCDLAQQADVVERVICGLGQRIKG